MKFEVVLTEQQEQGLRLKLQEQNAKRLRPIVVNGAIERLSQLTESEFVQWLVETVAEDGRKMQEALEQAGKMARFEAALADPAKKGLVDQILNT